MIRTWQKRQKSVPTCITPNDEWILFYEMNSFIHWIWTAFRLWWRSSIWISCADCSLRCNQWHSAVQHRHHRPYLSHRHARLRRPVGDAMMRNSEFWKTILWLWCRSVSTCLASCLNVAGPSSSSPLSFKVKFVYISFVFSFFMIHLS